MLPLILVLTVTLAATSSRAADRADIAKTISTNQPAGPGLTLEETFRNPPNAYRLVQYGLYGQALEKYPRYGIGGFMTFFYFNIYHTNPASVKQISTLVDAAQKKEMRVWLGDDAGYPSGMAGGRVVQQNPAYEVRGLAMITKNGTGEGTVAINLPAGAERFACAILYPLSNGMPDLARGQVTSFGNSRIETTGLEGPWQLCAFATVIRNKDVQAQSTMEQFGHTGRYPDLLNPDAVASFIAKVHAPIAAQIKNLPAKAEGFYANEPNLMQVHWKQTRAPFACVSWNDKLLEKFTQMHGYDLLPWLGALFQGNSLEARRVRMHFQQTVAELLTVNFARQIREWCNAHGTHSSGHFLLDEHLCMHVAGYGDYMKFVSEFDVPAIDTAIPNPDGMAAFHYEFARFTSSVTTWKERDRTLCLLDPIIGGGGHKRLSPAMPLMLNSVNMAFFHGITEFSSYTPLDPVSEKGKAATGYSVADYRAFNEYIGRIAALLHAARLETSVALYYPIAMFQADYRPSNQHFPKIVQEHQKRQGAWDNTCKALLDADIEFTIIHPDAVAQSAVADGRMKIGFGDYRYLVMPQVDFLPLAVLEKIKAFEAGGGTVLWVDTKPQAGIYTRDDAKIAAALKTKTVIHPANLATNIANPYAADFNLRFEPAPVRLSVARFRRGDRPVYFLVNRTSEPVTAGVQSPAAIKAKVYDPITGAITETTFPAKLKIDGFRSLLISP